MLDIIIIGAGPAGISMAVEARHAGIQTDKILVLEKSSQHSYSVRKLYPEQKLVTANYKGQDAVCFGVMCLCDSSKAETLSYIDQAISDNEIQVQYETQVQSIKKNEEGVFQVSTDKGDFESKICVVAIGIFGKPKRPDYSLPSLPKKIHFDLTSNPVSGKNVLVVGGGDSASEYAQYLVQEKKEVTLSYRRSEFTRMNPINKQSLLSLIADKKVTFLPSSHIEKVTEIDDDLVVSFAEENYGKRPYDHIVYALGGTTPQNFLKVIGVEIEEGQNFNDGQETNIAGLYLVGDLSAGRKGGSIISAFNSSHMAMRKICENYLRCEI